MNLKTGLMKELWVLLSTDIDGDEGICTSNFGPVVHGSKEIFDHHVKLFNKGVEKLLDSEKEKITGVRPVRFVRLEE